MTGYQGMTLGTPLPPGKRPSSQLELEPWLQLLHLVGYWDDGVSLDEVWERIDAWDREQLAAQETAQ